MRFNVYNRFKLPDSQIKLEQAGFVPLPSYPGKGATTYTNDWIYGVNKHSKNRDATIEFLDYISAPEIERSILLDPKENDVVCVHWSNLRDPQINARFTGMHKIAADALEQTKNFIPNIPEFLPVVDVLSAAMSDIVTSGGGNIKEKLDAAATQAARVMRRGG